MSVTIGQQLSDILRRKVEGALVIRLLETEAKSKIEYLEYLAGVIDPRD